MNRRQAIELCRIGQGMTYNPARVEEDGQPINEWTGRGASESDDTGWSVRYHPEGPEGFTREWETVEEALTFMCGIGMHVCDVRRELFEAFNRRNAQLEEPTDG